MMAEEAFDRYIRIRAEPSGEPPYPIPPLEGTPVLMGQITSPSGTIAVVDMSLGIGYLAFEEMKPAQDAVMIQAIIRTGKGVASVHCGPCYAVVVGDVPTDRKLQVYGTGMNREPDWPPTFWQWVYLDVRPGAGIDRSEYLDCVNTDYSQILFADVVALREWHQIESIDGKADVTFWGRDEERFAREVGASRRGELGFRLTDIPCGDAEKLEEGLEHLCSQLGLAVRIAAYEHAHKHYMDDLIFSGETMSGTLEIGGAQVCGFRTGISGAEFPVIRDLDREGRLVRIRIYLGHDG
jgi:hypothetical protein